MLDVVAAPIPAEIVMQHISRAADLLPAHRADGLLLFRNSNLLGFCGVPLGPTDRLVCGLMNADGQLAFIVPEFESEMAGTLPSGSRLFTWKEHEDPYALLATAAEDLGIGRSTILIDSHTWISAQREFERALSGATLKLDPGVIESVRKVKTPEEIEAIRGACADVGQIYDLVTRHLRPGITEKELSREVLDLLEKRGIQPFGDLIQGGESASVPHQPAGQRRFRHGDAVIVDFVAQRESYLGDMTRTFGIDPISSDIKEAYRAVRAAQQTAIAMARPGITCESVDNAARKIIEAAGLGDFFVHRLGHGIGLDVHEPPYFVRGNKEILEPGMCITVEPGVYIPDRFGIRIEDVIAIKMDGCEVLSRQTPTDVSQVLCA